MIEVRKLPPVESHPGSLRLPPCEPGDFRLQHGPAVDRLVAEKPYYARVTIPGDLYPNNPQDTQTYGVLATVVASAKTSPDVVYTVVKAVFDNLERFKRLHPAFKDLDEQEMIKAGLSAPLHEGAVRYYKERGWM